ncbi:inorganic diphosphatase [Hymenobacter busanensis]|nr:inorganic diphosphatase [Hymenobacter busanensis]QHJ09205.1 inorganic diphosphatase [Hymenobacter busanensis]
MPFRLFRSAVAHLTLVGCATVVVAACQPHYEDLPTFSDDRHLLQVVVETPAGSNHELRYSLRTREFSPVLRAGTARVVQFLPYPTNVGFIPSTQMPATGQRPAAPQTALVLTESVEPGTVLEVLPVAMLLLDNAGEMESVVVTVPARPSQQVLPVSSWQELKAQYPAVPELLRLWYQNHAGRGQVRVVGWRDENAALQHVRTIQRR